MDGRDVTLLAVGRVVDLEEALVVEALLARLAHEALQVPRLVQSGQHFLSIRIIQK